MVTEKNMVSHKNRKKIDKNLERNIYIKLHYECDPFRAYFNPKPAQILGLSKTIVIITTTKKLRKKEQQNGLPDIYKANNICRL